MKQTYDCKVLEHEAFNDEIFRILIEKHEGMENILSGQFFGIQVSKLGLPLLRRPISVSRVDKDSIEFVIKLHGVGTKIMYDLSVGDTINVLGPLGNGFFLENASPNCVIVGGGIGVSPIKELARVLKNKFNKSVPVLLGFRNDPFDMDDFNIVSDNIKIATENGSIGHKGYVTYLLKEVLENSKPEVVYVCGPHVMLEAVNSLCKEYNVETQLLMEERMACGIGACLVCTCSIKEGNEVKNKRVCKDGPVFYGSEVVF